MKFPFTARVFPMLVLALLIGFTTEAYATSVTNNGTTAVLVRGKNADGTYANPIILAPKGGGAGSTATLPEGVTRVRVNPIGEGDLNVSVTKGDGSTINIGNTQEDTSILVEDAVQPVQRTNTGTNVMPKTTVSEVKETVPKYNGSTLGVGLGPAASDGPVTIGGIPVGQIKYNGPAWTWGEVQDEWDLTDDELKEIRRDYPDKSPEEINDMLEAADFFWWLFSGSGGGWGDCVGTTCQHGIYTPGNPLGGPPVGSWIHFDRSNTLFSNNLDLLDRSNFESEFGSFPTESRFSHLAD